MSGGRGPNQPPPGLSWSPYIYGPKASRQLAAESEAARAAKAVRVPGPLPPGGAKTTVVAHVRTDVNAEAAAVSTEAALRTTTAADPAGAASRSRRSTAVEASREARLLATTTTYVEVKFDIVTDLAEAGYADASSFLEATTAALLASVADGSLEALLEAECGCDVDAASITFLATDRYPTLRPTPIPTPAPTPAPTPQMCSYEFLPCGTSLEDNNFNHGTQQAFCIFSSSRILFVCTPQSCVLVTLDSLDLIFFLMS